MSRSALRNRSRRRASGRPNQRSGNTSPVGSDPPGMFLVLATLWCVTTQRRGLAGLVSGLLLGEGAGLVVLERCDTAAGRGWEPLGHLLGHASTADGRSAWPNGSATTTS